MSFFGSKLVASRQIVNALSGKNGTSKKVVKNKSNDYEVSFAKNANVNKLVILQKDNFELSWKLKMQEMQVTKLSQSI